MADLIQGGIHDPIRKFVHAVGKEGDKDCVELALIGHRIRPRTTATGRSSASMAARIARWA
jgi:hypothetical protein